MRPRLLSLVSLVPLLLAACQQDGDPGRTGPTSTSPTGATATGPTTTGPTSTGSTGSGDLADARIELQPFATLEQPLALAVRAGDDRLFFAEKTGRVVAVPREGGDPEVILDLSGEVSTAFNEQGLLGLAFSPEGDYLYVNYTDTGGDTRIAGYAFGDDGVDLASRRELLFLDDPFPNHNGGNLVFGSDGYLYVGMGDGGDAGDPFGNGQSLSTLFGKMLRIAPTPAGDDPYEIPPDNPFVDRADALPEIWDYGLRNPWRYSFDRETGDLWIGDVGQGVWEEIDVEPAGSGGGLNFGWDLLEGSFPFERGEDPGDTVLPVHEYRHQQGGCAVTGGYVYRGSAIPDLVGAYVFGDFCLGRLEAFVLEGGRAAGHRDLGVGVRNLASFGEDAEGELYVLSLDGPVFRVVPAG
jgi:glucose/arabinose dehydrogenase